MNKRISISFMVLMLAAVGFTANGYNRRAEPRGINRHQPDPRLEQFRQESQKSAAQIDQTLKTLFETINKNHRPDDEVITNAAGLLKDSRRFGKIFEDKDKAKYMLLQSWVYFFEGNIPLSLNWSMRACKTYEPAKDGWTTQALFSMLTDKSPMRPRPQRQKRPSRRPGRNDDMFSVMSTLSPMSENGTLDFDFMGIRNDFLKQRFTRFTVQTVSGDSIEYKPSEDTLCMLFWQEETTVDVNDIKTLRTNPMMEFGEMNMHFESSHGASKTDIQSQRKYFETLIEACKERSNIKFVQINTSPMPGNVTQESASEIPSVIAAQPQSNAERFLQINAQSPFLVIVGTEGKTKYAGTAAGFVPAFILTEITGTQIDLQQQKRTYPVEHFPGEMMTDPMMFDPMMMEMGMMVPHSKKKVEPQKPQNEPNEPAIGKRPMSKKAASDFPTQPLEEQVRAEKLLQSAYMHIEESRKLSMKNPKQGIEDARRVLAEFPNTEYAKQARELLRRVPDRWKKRHNITNEELGY